MRQCRNGALLQTSQGASPLDSVTAKGVSLCRAERLGALPQDPIRGVSPLTPHHAHHCKASFYPYKKGSKFLELISRVLLLMPRKKQLQIRNKLQARIFKYNMLDKDYDLMFLACPADLKIVYPEKIFDEVIDVSFEQKTVSLHKNYDEILKIKFGDYMQLPPPEERVCRHEPVVLDFGE